MGGLEVMDVFQLRSQVVDDYARYVKSFVKIRDDRIAAFAEEQLEKGVLWPDPILQLNPAYEPGPTLPELVEQGVLHPDTARFFRKGEGSPIRLYQHQYEAILLAQQQKSYVVTTGTGSGKSLTYLIPIYDYLVRNPQAERGVRALIVYPMNALINSQHTALKAYSDAYRKQYGEPPIRFAKYTGQEKGEAREEILANPPDILLTNYVMLELMMVRPS